MKSVSQNRSLTITQLTIYESHPLDPKLLFTSRKIPQMVMVKDRVLGNKGEENLSHDRIYGLWRTEECEKIRVEKEVSEKNLRL